MMHRLIANGEAHAYPQVSYSLPEICSEVTTLEAEWEIAARGASNHSFTYPWYIRVTPDNVTPNLLNRGHTLKTNNTHRCNTYQVQLLYALIFLCCL